MKFLCDFFHMLRKTCLTKYFKFSHNNMCRILMHITTLVKGILKKSCDNFNSKLMNKIAQKNHFQIFGTKGLQNSTNG